jgi:hypothetical protein
LSISTGFLKVNGFTFFEPLKASHEARIQLYRRYFDGYFLRHELGSPTRVEVGVEVFLVLPVCQAALWAGAAEF